MIEYECPYCSSKMFSPDSLVGQYETCPRCGAKVKVPEIELNEEPAEGSAALQQDAAQKPDRAGDRQVSVKNKVLHYILQALVWLAIAASLVYSGYRRAARSRRKINFDIYFTSVKEMKEEEKIAPGLTPGLAARIFVIRSVNLPPTDIDCDARHLGGGYYYVHGCVEAENLLGEKGEKLRRQFVMIIYRLLRLRLRSPEVRAMFPDAGKYKLISGPASYDPENGMSDEAHAIYRQAQRIAKEQAKIIGGTCLPCRPAGRQAGR